jgi:hypothetical protein
MYASNGWSYENFIPEQFKHKKLSSHQKSKDICNYTLMLFVCVESLETGSERVNTSVYVTLLFVYFSYCILEMLHLCYVSIQSNSKMEFS